MFRVDVYFSVVMVFINCSCIMLLYCLIYQFYDSSEVAIKEYILVDVSVHAVGNL